MTAAETTAPAADLVLAHALEDGTTITGDTYRWREAIKALGGGFVWSRRAGCYVRVHSRGAAAPTVPLERWAERLRAKGATVRVEAVAEVTEEQAREAKRTVLLERAERAGRGAERARAEAASRFAASHAATDGIPMGQPILVGHHSQRRHERAIERAHAHMGRAVEAARDAERLRNRAARLERAAEALAPEAVATVENGAAWVDAVADLIRGRLKKDAGAELVRQTHKGAGARAWRIYAVRWAGGLYVTVHVAAHAITVADTTALAVADKSAAEAYDVLAGFARKVGARAAQQASGAQS